MRKQLYFNLVFALLLLPAFAFAATPYNPSLGSHPLQQVTTDQTGATSVDANSDGIVDQANTALSIGDQTAIGDGTGNAILSIKGATTLWSAIDFYSGNTAYWGVGRSKVFGDYRDNDFYIDRTGVRRALTIDQSTLNVGIDTDKPQNKLDVRGAIGLSLSDTQTVAKLYQSANDGNLELFTGEATPVSRIRLNSYGNSYIAPASGNVGIGTAGPMEKLDVRGNTDIYGNIGLVGNTGTISPRNSGAGYMRIFGGGTNEGGAIEFRGGGNGGDLRFLTGTTGAGTERIRIQSGGNVGIGTASPGAKLHVESGASNVARFYSSDYFGEIFVGQSLTANKATALGYNVNGGYTFLQTYGDPWGTFVIKNGGNVGIGTTGPGYKLDVQGTTATVQESISTTVTGTTANVALRFAAGDGANWFIGRNPAGDSGTDSFAIREAGAGDRLIIKSGGNVGIGTTGPTEKLDVGGNIKTSDNVILGGPNSWILHTPDDGRTTLYIAPGTNGGSWNWGTQVRIDNNADLTSSGAIYSNNWFRTYGATGLYSQSYDMHIWPLDGNSNYWGSRSNYGWRYQDRSGNNKGYLYFDSSGFGILSSDGSWRLRTNPGYQEFFGSTYIYGDLYTNSVGWISTALSNKAGTSGSYPGLSVGYASSAGSVAWSNVANRPRSNRERFNAAGAGLSASVPSIILCTYSGGGIGQSFLMPLDQMVVGTSDIAYHLGSYFYLRFSGTTGAFITWNVGVDCWGTDGAWHYAATYNLFSLMDFQ